MFKGVKLQFLKMNEWLNLHWAFTSSPLRELGLIMAFSSPLFYFLWSYIYVEPYESFSLRAIVLVLGLLMGLSPYWPHCLKPFESWFWLASLIIIFPFFYTYYFLMNEGTMISVLSLLSSIFLLVLIVDTRLFFLILIVGMFLAAVFYYYSVPLMYFGEEQIDMSLVFVFIVISGMFVRYKQHLFIQMRLQGMAAAAGMIAHELRTPLLSIRAGAKGLDQHLPTLLEAYHKAVAHDLIPPVARPTRLLQLNDVLKRLEREVDYSNVMIDMLLYNAKSNASWPGLSFELCSMKNTIESALYRYPFKSDDERSLIHVEGDFLYMGSTLLMEHVLFNLIKNALTQIQKVQKGAIFIQALQDKEGAILYFKDTARGMSQEEVSQIFTHFYSNTISGTGLGLSFCREALNQMGASITCFAKLQEHTTFKMTFGRVDKGI